MEEASQRNEALVDRESNLDPQERETGAKESYQIFGHQQASFLVDEFNLFLKHCLAAVVSKDQEVTHRSLSSLKIFVEAACQIIGFKNEKDNTRDFA